MDILASKFGLLTVLKGGAAKEGRQALHALILLALVLFSLDHAIEGLFGCDQQFLPTGRDAETTLFVVFLLLGLAFALVNLIHACANLLRRLEGLLAFLHLEIPAQPFALAIRPVSSPPVPLRI